jgi:23S rRNA (adenine2503-C2)-methyltransferase
MKIIAKTGNTDIATVYVAEMSKGRLVEFVESVQPPIPLEKKWVLIISTLYGCPVKCGFCDSGGFYKGKLSAEEMFAQIDYPIVQRFSDRRLTMDNFKIQFARMGEPAFNHAVIDVLEEFPNRYDAPGFIPSISTVAPNNTDEFFERLLDVKRRLYKDRFQMQFSLHTTNQAQRDKLIPTPKWDFAKIAEYSRRFFAPGDRKITLNFALAEEYELDTKVLLEYFDPGIFFIKLTPINPTYRAIENNLVSKVVPENDRNELFDSIKAAGYDGLLSIGELEENDIGSNCGQHVMNHLRSENKIEKGYSYELEMM